MGNFRRYLWSLATAAVVIPLSSVLVRADQVAFFYALDADLQTLKAQSHSTGKTIRVGSRSIYTFEIGNHRVYAVKMGSGVVETAASAQALLAKVSCDLAISVGPVGGISDSLNVATWHLVTNVVCYQKGSWTKDGFSIGAPVDTGKHDSTNRLAKFVPALFTNVTEITLASGEIFVASTSYREQLRETTRAQAVDMNLYGLLTVCNDHNVTLTSWRVVSDHADDNAGDAFRTFVAKYDGEGGKAVAQYIAHLPTNPNFPAAYPNLQRALKNTEQ
jgi:adenosylhomocysteine/aminodeoxyfutalosine nucleosidase